MHELGHNFGLLHGGVDCYNNKPNYISVMNYSDRAGIEVAASPGSATPISCSTDADCTAPAHCDTLNLVCSRLDYSDRIFSTLDENNLDETVGFQGGAGDSDISWTHVVKPTTGFVRVPTNGTAIDWNNDSAIETGIIFDCQRRHRNQSAAGAG